MEYLHSRRPAAVIHGDLKAANLLWDEGRVKISDFGAARVCDTV